MKEKKNIGTKIAEKTIVKIAELYAGFLCQGRWFEPKMPKKLQK